MFSLLDTFFIAFHDDCDEHILHSCVEQYHKHYQVELAAQPFSPSLQKRIIDYIPIEQGEQCDDRGGGVLEFGVLPEDSLPEEDKAKEEWHHSQQEYEEIAPGLC